MRGDLTKVTAQGADFTGANMLRTVLEFADLRGARFDNANLATAMLAGANLDGASVAGADFTDADVTSTRLTGFPVTTAPISTPPATWAAQFAVRIGPPQLCSRNTPRPEGLKTGLTQPAGTSPEFVDCFP